ncbi:MAG: response regulator, partial [Bacteroidetes bacterium]|nr:response regulator [Bacteroidota bacterium]
RFSFRQMLGTVKQLSSPNTKLQLVNNIFRELVSLDQKQQAQSLKKSGITYDPLLKESGKLQLMLDTLRTYSRQNITEVNRIDSMKSLLYARDKLFISYLQLNTYLSHNDTLTRQIKQLSARINDSMLNVDTSVVTTEQKITTTTIEGDTTPNNEHQTFWDRVFNRKKPGEARQVKRLIQQELNIKVDTLALAKEDSFISTLSDAIMHQEASRESKRNKLIRQQMQLAHAGNVLINELLSILQNLEAAEVQHAEARRTTATHIVNEDITKLDAILICFILGTAILVYFIFIDIGHSNKYREQLLDAKENAEELERVKQRFLSNMSHELRTPLQTIVGVAEQLRMKGSAKPNELEVIYQSSQHLLQIVNEVLDYSRIISGKFSFASVSFSMQHLLKEVQDIMQVQADKKQLQLIFDVDINSAQDNIGDPFRLRQILYNLLGNAIKFTNKGAVTLLVSQKDFSNRTAYTFIVKDTGVGISGEDINKIFNQFEQAKNSANHNGTGLGLNIVQALVESQKGNIQVKSILGQGSEFIVALSFAKARPLAPQTEDNTQSNDAYAGKVWIIDDDKFILQLCSGIMEKHHIPYRAFASPKEVLATPYDNEVTTIFLDIRMPDISGIELCRMLRQRMATHSAKLIALTAQAFPDEKERLLLAGFDTVLMKPFMEQDIINLLHGKEVPKILPQLPSGEEINIQPLMTMAGNDIEFVKAALQSFITETTKDLDKVRIKNISRGDYSAIAELLHPIAGRCAQIGARQLSRQLRDVEISLRNNQLTGGKENKINEVCDSTMDIIAQVRLLIPTLTVVSVPSKC